MTMWRKCMAAGGLLGLVTTAALSQVAMEGQFTAFKACPATQSIKSGNNPGKAMVEAGKAYRLVGKNRQEASHYFVEVPGAQPLRRWVAVSCGTVGGAAETAPQAPKPRKAGEAATGNSYVLAISWQPAFCEGKPDKTECRNQTAASFEASHFTLHGLWPQPRRRVFCGVSRELAAADNDGRWADLPQIQLSAATRTALEQVMPGTQSLLERHEWIKHGTCYPGADAEQYYKDAVRVMAAINASKAQELAASRVGNRITGAELRQAFDASFGAGTGERVRVACKPDGNRQLIVEITIGLRGDVSGNTDVSQLIRASTPTDPGCPGGIIDPVGLQ